MLERLLPRDRDGGWDWLGRLLGAPWPSPTLELEPALRLGGLPAADVYERDGSVVVTLELPGVAPEDVDVRVHEDRVTVRAESRREEGVRGEGYFRAERRYGALYRTIPLPHPVEPQGAQASLKHGVLRIEIPKRRDPDRLGHRVAVRAE